MSSACCGAITICRARLSRRQLPQAAPAARHPPNASTALRASTAASFRCSTSLENRIGPGPKRTVACVPLKPRNRKICPPHGTVIAPRHALPCRHSRPIVFIERIAQECPPSPAPQPSSPAPASPSERAAASPHWSSSPQEKTPPAVLHRPPPSSRPSPAAPTPPRPRST